jgi:CRISPR/Cas system CMR subunit Cmr4 (Cas7 group RAMP superfamily)
MHAHVFLVHALTPIHIGNDIGLGAINLPTMREVHTGYPVLPGSSIKGVLRGQARDRPGLDIVKLFGPERGAEEDRRGDLAFGDAQLLALPVRSLYGTFAWITCPFALARLARDLKQIGKHLPPVTLQHPGEALTPDDTSALTPEQPAGRRHDAREDGARGERPHEQLPATGRRNGAREDGPRGERRAREQPVADRRHDAADRGDPAPPPDATRRVVFLEDFALTARPDHALAHAAREILELASPQLDRDFFRRRLLCVHDDLFAHFARVGLEVRARVKLDEDTGTAAKSGPWTEEHLPAESLLCGLVVGRHESPTCLAPLLGELRIGGRATLGLGRAHMTLSSTRTR